MMSAESAQAAAEAEMVDVGLDEIQRLIPHRYPFLMIDKVIDLVPGQRAIGIKNVTINEPFFPGHFPGRPVMPGVLIVEAMAQTAAIAVVKGLGQQEGSGNVVYFMAIDRARFRQPVLPGDRLELHVSLIKGRAKVWRFAGEARVDGTVRAEAEFMAMIMPPEEAGAGG
jgi:3-hydroxyacyl-[acyl-carrier-protein] dehydratase